MILCCRGNDPRKSYKRELKSPEKQCVSPYGAKNRLVDQDTIWAEAPWWRRSWRTSWGRSPSPCRSRHPLWRSLTRTNQQWKVYFVESIVKFLSTVFSPGKGLGSEHMVQILSNTSRPVKWSRNRSGNLSCSHLNSEAGLRTERVEDVGDEDKLAGVELDHGRVGQELGALENIARVGVGDEGRMERIKFCSAALLPGWRSSGLWPSGLRTRPPSGTGSAPRYGWRSPAGRGLAAPAGNPAHTQAQTAPYIGSDIGRWNCNFIFLYFIVWIFCNIFKQQLISWRTMQQMITTVFPESEQMHYCTITTFILHDNSFGEVASRHTNLLQVVELFQAGTNFLRHSWSWTLSFSYSDKKTH